MLIPTYSSSFDDKSSFGDLSPNEITRSTFSDDSLPWPETGRRVDAASPTKRQHSPKVIEDSQPKGKRFCANPSDLNRFDQPTSYEQALREQRKGLYYVCRACLQVFDRERQLTEHAITAAHQQQSKKHSTNASPLKRCIQVGFFPISYDEYTLTLPMLKKP